MPVRTVPKHLIPNDQPMTAGGVEYAGVPQDRLLFAVYDAEMRQREHTDATYHLCDQVDSLKDEISSLSENVSKQSDEVRKLSEAVNDLTDAMERLTKQLGDKDDKSS